MKKNILSILLILIALGLVVFLGKIIIKNSSRQNEKNPYELNIDSIGAIEKSKIGYEKIQEIKLELKEPTGIAIDLNDKIYVTGDSVLLIFNQEGKQISRFNIQQNARCITVSKDLKIYLGMKNHVEVYNSDGMLQNIWKSNDTASVFTSIAVSKQFVYAADAEKGFVYQYDFQGKFLNFFGTKDSTDEIKRFVIPSYYFDVVIDDEDQLWIVNPGRHLLINFKPDGNIRSYWGNTSSGLDGFCGCCNPTHIAVLDDGSFITSEKGIVRVKKYSSAGTFICAVAGPDSFYPNSTGLDITTDSKQNIYVLEPQARRIHIFKEKNKEHTNEQ